MSPTTGNVMVQVLPAGIVPPVNENCAAPGAAFNVPPQVVVAAGVLATVIPAGKVSFRLVLVNGRMLSFLSVIVICDVWPVKMLLGEKVLALTCGKAVSRRITVSEALAVCGTSWPSARVAPAGMVLV